MAGQNSGRRRLLKRRRRTVQGKARVPTPEQPQPRKPPGQRPVLLRYAGMGLELAAGLVGLTLVGLWVDAHFGTRPYGLLAGAGIGVVGGLYNFLRQALQMQRDSRQAMPSPSSGPGPTDDEHGAEKRKG